MPIPTFLPQDDPSLSSPVPWPIKILPLLLVVWIVLLISILPKWVYPSIRVGVSPTSLQDAPDFSNPVGANPSTYSFVVNCLSSVINLTVCSGASIFPSLYISKAFFLSEDDVPIPVSWIVSVDSPILYLPDEWELSFKAIVPFPSEWLLLPTASVPYPSAWLDCPNATDSIPSACDAFPLALVYWPSACEK